MSKQTAEPRSAAGAEEKSSTGVLDDPEVDRQALKQDHDTARQKQKERLAGLGIFAFLLPTPEAFGGYIEDEIKKYAKVVKDSGSRID